MSQLSKQSTSKIKYGTKKRINYKNRIGERNLGPDDEAPDILRADYPCFVDESKTTDGNLTSFEAFSQIYGAFNRHQNEEIMRIKR